MEVNRKKRSMNQALMPPPHPQLQHTDVRTVGELRKWFPDMPG